MGKLLSGILVISDMDDTLLMPDKSLSTENLRAILKLRKLGGKFTIATGRSIESFQQYQTLISPDMPVILNNGAVIYDTLNQEMIWNSLLPKTARKYLEETIQKFPVVGAEVLAKEGMYIANRTAIIQEHIDREHLHRKILSSNQVPEHWFKVLFAMESSIMKEFTRYLFEKNHEDVTYIQSSSRYCEMLPKGSSKGHAMKKLLQLIQEPIEFVCGIGDYYNDAELIQFSDVGIAVQNAPRDIRNLADQVVCENSSHAMIEIVEWLIDMRNRKSI